MKTTNVPKRFALTCRETEVVRLLAKGRLNKEIADELGISFAAVHQHQHRIFLKLQVGNRTEAAIKWIEARQGVTYKNRPVAIYER
jgi:DNA-binding NarL/FixJ family response regulator